MGDAAVAAAAKTISYRLDPHAVVDRAAKAETERTVTIRPAPDTMTYLTALLPVAQGVSVYAALRREADVCADGRSRGQVMADTLVERTTGRCAAAATPIAVNLVLSDETLFGRSHAPATVSGYGPIPATVARDLVSGAVGDQRSRAMLRRLYAHPTSGALVAMESRARLFPRGLAAFIGLRDQRCRTPYCDAPIRHRDHAQPWAGGGGTSAGNGLGLCERCNYVKEVAGWCVESNVDEIGRHTAQFTTPTGAHYRSAAPPRAPTITTSDVEVRMGITLARHAAYPSRLRTPPSASSRPRSVSTRRSPSRESKPSSTATPARSRSASSSSSVGRPWRSRIFNSTSSVWRLVASSCSKPATGSASPSRICA